MIMIIPPLWPVACALKPEPHTECESRRAFARTGLRGTPARTCTSARRTEASRLVHAAHLRLRRTSPPLRSPHRPHTSWSTLYRLGASVYPQRAAPQSWPALIPSLSVRLLSADPTPKHLTRYSHTVVQQPTAGTGRPMAPKTVRRAGGARYSARGGRPTKTSTTASRRWTP